MLWDFRSDIVTHEPNQGRLYRADHLRFEEGEISADG